MALKEVAYKPAQKASISNVEATQKIDTPNYPDVGVSYANFSKKLIGNNIYKLNHQDIVDLNIKTVYTGGETRIGYYTNNYLIKDFYCTSMTFSGYRNNIAYTNLDLFSVASDTALKLIFLEPIGDILAVGAITPSVWTKSFNFDVPILFPKGKLIYIGFDRARVAGEALYLNLYGWEEDPNN